MTTVQDVLQQVYRTYEGDTDYPLFDDEDMQLYFEHLKDSLKTWVKKFPQYRESYAELTDAADGDKVTTAGVKTINAPTNFIRPATFITVGSKTLDYLPPQKMELMKKENPMGEWFSYTGYPGAYKIVLNPVPGAVEAVSYPYYKSLTAVTGASSVLEISRPDYCVFYILNKLYADDEANKDLAKEYRGMMNDEVSDERIELAKLTTGQPNRMRDMGYLRYGAGFGRLGSSED